MPISAGSTFATSSAISQCSGSSGVALYEPTCGRRAITLATASVGDRSPVTFLNCCDETMHARSPFALLTMPELQLATPAKRTPPVVCSRVAGVVVPMPTLPALSIAMRLAPSVARNSFPEVPLAECAFTNPVPAPKELPE